MALRTRTQRSLLLGFIASVSLCGLVGIYCLVIGQIGPFEEKILATTGIVSACSILGLAAAVPWERRRWYPIGPLAATGVTAALIMSLTGVWVITGFNEQFWRALMVMWIIAITLCHVGLLSLARLRTQWTIIQTATVVCAVLLAGELIAMIVWDISDDILARIAGVLGILTACGTVSLPILHRISAMQLREAVRTVELQIALTCPRCNRAQTLAVGRSRCRQCGLKFAVEIEEDNCKKCGYPLYQIQSAVCPECGTAIVLSRETTTTHR